MIVDPQAAMKSRITRLKVALELAKSGTISGMIRAREIVLAEQRVRLSQCSPTKLKGLIEVLLEHPEEPVVSIAGSATDLAESN